MIEHRSVCNFIKGITDIVDFNEDDRLLSLTTISFDIFGLEAFVPIARGARVVIGNRDEQLNNSALIAALCKHEITIFQVTPSRLQLLFSDDGAPGMLNKLKYLLVGGEAFPEALLKKARTLVPGKIYNLYGPTETTIWSTAKDVAGENSLNIGKPIANTQIYILGERETLTPIGVIGELCIGGDGLARGYVNRPELTTEKFIKNRSYRSYKTYNFYKTGDLARWLDDGNIEFLGRIDHQVKIRGFRVELGEIENQLLNHGGIKGAAVLVKDQHLYAYIAVNDQGEGEGEFNLSLLRSYLSEKLPDYMIPSYFVQVEGIPLTASGKVDRKALDLIGKQLAPDAAYTAPQNELEKKIAEAWKEVLHLEKVGIHDNYFELGGTSFDIIKINRKLKEIFQIEVPMVVMFRHTTVHAFAAFLNQENGDIHDRAAALERGKRDKRERLQRRKGAGPQQANVKAKVE
ncbi:MAG: non-ribosomal peptide synthetase [Candidatus Aminicenantes bacterium]|nr:non-ribosomal peptide synthetase [Candidatus Aminicenantes bacterium]